jgi:flagellar biosynthetic protein FlhB
MSDTEDRESRTEEASEKKLRDSVEKGNVPFSREVPTLFSLLAVIAGALLLLPMAVERMTRAMQVSFAEAGLRHIEHRNDALALFSGLGREIAIAGGPLLLILMLAGIAGSLVQNPFQITWERVEPKWSRLSPREGLRRLFGIKGLAEFAKSVFKFSAVSLISYLVVKSELADMIASLIRPPQLLPGALLQLSVKLIAWIALAALVLATADMFWSRFSWRRDLRMSKQEIKDEHRQAEGDPMVKHRFKMLARARASRRMMAKVPKATMIITNPTHYAIALRYDRTEDAAPVVLAKGLDQVALRIRALAEEHDIPIIENKPLARALYEKAALDAMIPPEFFRAVAEIIHYLNMRRMAAT